MTNDKNDSNMSALNGPPVGFKNQIRYAWMESNNGLIKKFYDFMRCDDDGKDSTVQPLLFVFPSIKPQPRPVGRGSVEVETSEAPMGSHLRCRKEQSRIHLPFPIAHVPCPMSHITVPMKYQMESKVHGDCKAIKNVKNL